MRPLADERAKAPPEALFPGEVRSLVVVGRGRQQSPHLQRTHDDAVAGGREIGHRAPGERLAARDGAGHLPVAACDDFRERRLVERRRVDEKGRGDLDRLLRNQPRDGGGNARATRKCRHRHPLRVGTGLAEERREQLGELPELVIGRVCKSFEIGDRRHEHHVEPPGPVLSFEITEAIVHAHTYSDTQHLSGADGSQKPLASC